MILRYYLLLVFCFLRLSAQDMMVYYNISFKPDSLQEHYVKEEAVLDLSKTEAKFYSSEYLKMDSIQKSTGKVEFAYPKFNYKIKRRLNTAHNRAYYKISNDYYRIETEDIQHWNILSETKMSHGILLRKATTTFGKRNWEAWFAEEYPITEGPYKFRGLPGLIFELRDTKDNFIFMASRVVNKKETVNTENFLETNYGKKAIPINLKMYRKLNLEHFDNPIKDAQDIIVLDEHGNKKVIDMRAQAKKYQAFIKKNNNPIDLNLLVNYPDL